MSPGVKQIVQVAEVVLASTLAATVVGFHALLGARLLVAVAGVGWDEVAHLALFFSCVMAVVTWLMSLFGMPS